MRSIWLPGLVQVAVALCCATVAGAEEKALQAGQTFRDCSDCPEMVVIPAGSFLMGSSAADTARDLELKAVLPNDERRFARESMSSERPQHPVGIDRPFALGKHRVTRGEFAAFVRETGYLIEGSCTLWSDRSNPVRHGVGWQDPGYTPTDRDPVVCVNWQDAKAYIAWLNGKLRGRAPADGDGPYRLPNDAEWEYAARAGSQTARWWGDAIGSGNADCDGCGSRWDKQQPAPAGSFQTNPFGLSDVLGTTWEWNEDCWNETYAGAPQDGSAWTTGKCELRVFRGGSWNNHPWVLRSASRSGGTSRNRSNTVGFRIARTLP
jgi:formylglycine-generating enzyme required for sulfatase activity